MNPLPPAAVILAVLLLTPPAYPGGPKAYAAIDGHALKAPSQAEESLPSLAKYLAGPCKTDRDKARVVYRWITDRVAYDVQGLLTGQLGDTSPEAVLKSRKTVCEGYADLFVDLCERTGVKAAKVSGYAKIVGYRPGDKFTATNHAWNAVQIDGKWHLVDCILGAGALNGKQFEKKFSDFAFLPPPEALLFSHCPKDAKWQLVEPPLTLEQFERLPEVNRLLFEMGMTPARVKAAMAAKEFREFVDPFPTPGIKTTIVSVPLAKHLHAGKDYRFEIKSRECKEMVVANEGKFTFLQKSGDVFRGSVTAQKGQLIVGVLTGELNEKKQKRVWHVLRYVVE
jgi:hypothetical protein